MINLFGNSIRHKVTAAILVTSLASLTICFFVLVAVEWRNAERDLVERMQTAGRVLRENVAAAVAFQAIDDAEQMLSALQSNKEVVAAGLYGKGGALMAGFTRAEHSFELPDRAPGERVTERSNEVILVLPIETGGERIGSLLLAADYEARNQRFGLYLATAGGMFIIAIGVAALLSRILEERISKPILSLVETTRRVTGEGDYSVRVKAPDTKEVSLLADSFNQMLREINQREDELTRAMDRLRLTLDVSKTYTWEWKRETNQLMWQATDQMPTALAKLQGKSLGDFLLRVHPKDQRSLAEAYESAIAGEGEFEFDFQLLSEGEPVDLACRGKGFRDENGHIERALGVANDVSQKRQTERALYWRDQEFRALVEHSPDVIARYNRDLRLEYVNPVVIDYTGHTAEEFRGLTLEEMGVPEERTSLWRVAIERIYNGANRAEIEFEYRHADGSVRFFLARLVPEFAPSGEVAHVLAVSRDITERKQYEQELRSAKDRAEAAAQAKTVFLSNMSHDIRTPLTTILGCAELLQDRGDKESQEMVEMVKSGGKRLMDTLNSVLDLARLEGGDADLVFETVDVTAELAEIVRLFRVKAEEKQLELTFHAPEEVVYGHLDRAAFTRVVMNVLGNAVKFTSIGSIAVRLWHEDEHFFVSIEDTGPGIPKEAIASLFDAFTRSRQSEVRQIEGSGLGMTITRQLVRLMKGEIVVESSIGKGSVFTLSLDRAEAPSVKTKPTPESEPTVSSESPMRSILAVEDNQNTIRLLELLLAKRYNTAFATSGNEALERAQSRQFDLVLMDLGLETSEAGIGYMKELRAMKAYRSTPIVAFTAHALPGEAERFRRLGFDDYLGKPFTKDALEAVLARCLSSNA